MKYMAVKRIGDIFISLFLITLFVFPITVFIAAIRLTSKGKAIFKQIRVGRRGREFVCYKLRTMYEDAPKSIATSELCDAEKYVTPIGRFLRRTSIDELPQLINVIKGDMSIVGPRPLIPEETELHVERIKRGIYALRPGMTGLAQVRGRDMLSDGEKLDADEEYKENISFSFDLKILLSTARCVTSGRGFSDGKAKNGQ